jgi:hypothetical protein
MKSYKKQNFTLIEIMFVVTILVILIGISWVAGSKILRKSAEAQTKAEVTMLYKACVVYKAHFGSYPVETTFDADMDFVEHLSKIPPETDPNDYSGSKRPMLIDFRKANMNISPNDSYDSFGADGYTASDPYDQAYQYNYNTTTKKLYIYSKGLDTAESTDDVRSDKLNE